LGDNFFILWFIPKNLSGNAARKSREIDRKKHVRCLGVPLTINRRCTPVSA
jgi:hypothetical protein